MYRFRRSFLRLPFLAGVATGPAIGIRVQGLNIGSGLYRIDGHESDFPSMVAINDT